MLTIFIYSLYLQNIKRKAWAKYASPQAPVHVCITRLCNYTCAARKTQSRERERQIGNGYFFFLSFSHIASNSKSLFRVLNDMNYFYVALAL